MVLGCFDTDPAFGAVAASCRPGNWQLLMSCTPYVGCLHLHMCRPVGHRGCQHQQTSHSLSLQPHQEKPCPSPREALLFTERSPALHHIPTPASPQVSVISKLVTVQHDPATVSPAAIVAALNGVGLRARLLAGGRHGDGAAAAADAEHGGDVSGAGAGWRPPWQVLACGVLVLLSTASIFMPAPAAAWFEVLGLVAAGLGCPPVLAKAWSSLKGRILDINTLMLVALVGALALGDWTEAGALVFLFTLAEWLEQKCMGRAAGAIAEVLRMQPETALLLEAARGGGGRGGGCSGGNCGGGTCGANGCNAAGCGSDACGGGECGSEGGKCGDGGCGGGKCSSGACSGGPCSGETCTEASCKQACGAPSCGTPGCGSCKDSKPLTPTANGKSKGSGSKGSGASYVRVPAQQLQPGDLVLVRPGDRVPVDGTVATGSTTLDESMLTGESRPVSKSPGSKVLAGTVNSGTAALAVRVDTAPEGSTVARLGALIEQAGQSKSKRDRAIEVRWLGGLLGGGFGDRGGCSGSGGNARLGCQVASSWTVRRLPLCEAQMQALSPGWAGRCVTCLPPLA